MEDRLSEKKGVFADSLSSLNSSQIFESQKQINQSQNSNLSQAKFETKKGLRIFKTSQFLPTKSQNFQSQKEDAVGLDLFDLRREARGVYGTENFLENWVFELGFRKLLLGKIFYLFFLKRYCCDLDLIKLINLF